MVAVYLGLVFLSGAVVGAFGHRLYSVKTVSAGQKRSHDDYRTRYLKDMQSRLKLDQKQVGQLVVILDESRGRYKVARDRIDPEMKQIQNEQRDQIRGMLSEPQKAEYEKMLQERDRRQKGSSSGGSY
jgi:exonuclease III